MTTSASPTRIALPVVTDRAPLPPTAPKRSLLDTLLDQQSDLTAVEHFSRRHDDGALPAQSRYYRDLIPATPPGPGQHSAFEAALDACPGCKPCVGACHTLNGLNDDETWRGVGMLVGGSADHPVPQHVPTACHHCLEPACLDG